MQRPVLTASILLTLLVDVALTVGLLTLLLRNVQAADERDALRAEVHRLEEANARNKSIIDRYASPSRP